MVSVISTNLGVKVDFSWQKSFSDSTLFSLATIEIDLFWDFETWKRKKSRNNKAKEGYFYLTSIYSKNSRKSAILKVVNGLLTARFM